MAVVDDNDDDDNDDDDDADDDADDDDDDEDYDANEGGDGDNNCKALPCYIWKFFTQAHILLPFDTESAMLHWHVIRPRL
eukprot:5933759-Amphidinium_carterae.1